MLPQVIPLQLELPGVPAVICIQEGNKFPFCEVPAPVPRCCRTRIFAKGYHTDPASFIEAFQSANVLQRAIVAGIIDQQNFERLERLCSN